MTNMNSLVNMRLDVKDAEAQERRMPFSAYCRYKLASTKTVTQDTIVERTEKAYEFVKNDPDISLRTLGKALGCKKDASRGYKDQALEKIAYEKGVSQVSGVDRQTRNELFNNEGK